MASNRQVYRTEQDIAKLMASSGLPSGFTNQFTRDYAAVKGDMGQSDEEIEEIKQAVDLLDGRVSTAESEIGSLNSDVDSLNSSVILINSAITDLDLRIEILESELPELENEFNDHVADTQAHGANGNIVGTDDFCTTVVGGTVLLASALTPNANSTLIITATPTAPSAAYSQAEAITWVAAINELKTDFNALILEFNQLTAKVNDIISTQESANQRAT